jgi:hypothetical protein
MAQVYSVNAVGYVNVSVPAGKQAILNNPLIGTNNNVNTIMPLPNNAGYAASALFRYDSLANPPVFKDPIEWFDDFGWFSASDDNPTLAPGEGFYFRNANTVAANLTFVGEVPQGHLVNVIPGSSRLAFRGSQTPRALPLGDTTINAAGTLQFPAEAGDAVFFFNVTTARFDDPFEYFQDYGWFAATGDQGPAGPVINVATGFVVRSLNAQLSGKNWIQDFSVN